MRFGVWGETCTVMLLANLRHNYNIQKTSTCAQFIAPTKSTLLIIHNYCICYIFIHYVFKAAHGMDKLKVSSKSGYSHFIHKYIKDRASWCFTDFLNGEYYNIIIIIIIYLSWSWATC